MVLRLKTRESRSLPGLPSASVTPSLHTSSPDNDPHRRRDDPPETARSSGPSSFPPSQPRPTRRSGPGARRDTLAATPSAIVRAAAEILFRSGTKPSAVASRTASHPPPRPGRGQRRSLSGSTDALRARRSETLTAGWSSPVARQAHNLKVVGSNPAPATKMSPVDQGVGLAPPGFFVSTNPFRLIAMNSLYFSKRYISSGIRYDFAQNPPCHRNGT